jgi:fused signal recognition particle receptor
MKSFLYNGIGYFLLLHSTGTQAFSPKNVLPSYQCMQNSRTQLHMVFDFFKKRSEEGLQQLGKLSDAASRGQLGAGLKDAADYTRETNQAFASGLAKSRNRLLANLESIYTGSADALEDLQDTLLQADLGTATAEDIVREVKSLREDSTKFLSRDDLMSVMRGKLIETLDTGNSAVKFAAEGDKYPTVLFIMGANGMGKTTTIGKLAHRLRTEGNQTVLMAACDTFRAGAVEQLQQWADRAEVDIFGPSESAKSPAAVLYGALDKAIAGNYDTLLVDTSGRLSNNDALTAELVKMKNVIKKRLSLYSDEEGKPIPNEAVPHESLLVLDAAQGRMALDSAKVWDKEVGLTGLILTKLDGSARGGSVVAVSRELNLPVKLIGVGEGINDLRDVSYVLIVQAENGFRSNHTVSQLFVTV